MSLVVIENGIVKQSLTMAEHDDTKHILPFSGNLLKILQANSMSDTAPANTTLTRNLSAGTITLSINNAASKEVGTVQSEKIAPSGLPRILTFRITSVSGLNSHTTVRIGFMNAAATHYAWIAYNPATSQWTASNKGGVAETSDNTDITTNKIFSIYLTDGRVTFVKPPGVIISHITNLPTDPLGYIIWVLTDGTAASPSITLDYFGY